VNKLTSFPMSNCPADSQVCRGCAGTVLCGGTHMSGGGKWEKVKANNLLHAKGAKERGLRLQTSLLQLQVLLLRRPARRRYNENKQTLYWFHKMRNEIIAVASHNRVSHLKLYKFLFCCIKKKSSTASCYVDKLFWSLRSIMM
jgi:hypothetical protein